MEIVFLKAKQSLAKEISKEGTKPYPLTKNFTSIHYDIENDKKGFNQFYKLLTKHAASGHCLHKGALKKQLTNESRALMADRNAPTNLLVLDIDGLPYKTGNVGIETLAETIIIQLPELFHDVTYIAQASASLGFKKDKLSLHLFFFMDMPVHPKTLKDWLRTLNYNSDFLAEQIKLSANGQSLSYILDPSVADNSKLIYIAPPIFKDVQDPLPAGRFVKVDRGSPTLEISTALINVNPERVHALSLTIKNNLRKKADLPKKN